MSVKAFEFGLDTPAYVSVDESGQPINGDVVIRNTVEEAVLADSVGIDSFNISEHYRTDFMDSAGHVMLAAIAGRTNRIRLGMAVTVLSTQDPVRVYTQFATLDAVSDGRAQLIVGRGSLPDSFPLFGFDLADYETLFEEKLDLLTRLHAAQRRTRMGEYDAGVQRPPRMWFFPQADWRLPPSGTRRIGLDKRPRVIRSEGGADLVGKGDGGPVAAPGRVW